MQKCVCFVELHQNFMVYNNWFSFFSSQISLTFRESWFNSTIANKNFAMKIERCAQCMKELNYSNVVFCMQFLCVWIHNMTIIVVSNNNMRFFSAPVLWCFHFSMAFMTAPAVTTHVIWLFAQFFRSLFRSNFSQFHYFIVYRCDEFIIHTNEFDCSCGFTHCFLHHNLICMKPVQTPFT